MKKLLIILLLFSFSYGAVAESTPTFNDRIQLALLVEQRPLARTYIEQNLFPAMSSSMSDVLSKCLAKPNASQETFTIVANIANGGNMTKVEYSPKTNTAECFAASFRALRLPSPPKLEFGFLPIFLELKLT